MSTLRSYSFGKSLGVDELPVGVLNLFIGLAERPDKKIEFASEIVLSGLQGRIDLNSEFNIDAYEAAIRKNIRLGVESERKKKVYLDFSDGDDWDEVIASGGMKSDVASIHTVEQVQDAYEQLLLDEELEYAISTIKELQPILLVEEGIDFIYAMKQALKGIPDAIEAIKNICNEYEVVAEQVHSILSSGYTFEEIFA